MDTISGWKDKSEDYEECLDKHEIASKQSRKCKTDMKHDVTRWRADTGSEELY